MSSNGFSTQATPRKNGKSHTFVCAWCAEAANARAGDAEPSSTEAKDAGPAKGDNFGICDSCLQERLRVLEGVPVRPARKRSAQLESRSA